MSRNPYFSHLPTWRNRQDLAHALDSLPHILTSFTSSFSSLHSSPYSSASHSRSCSSISSTSTSSSIVSDNSQHHQQQRLRYQRRLVERHLSSNYNGHNILLFSTRAQAMGFLIDILRSLQEEPCKCDLVQGCFCSPEGVEDHSGMAPCYVCGEWYAEQVYCRDEETMEVYQVDGRRWHEQGASLRHHVAEASVREWLDQVVAVPQQQQYPRSATVQRANTCPTGVAASPRPTPTRTVSTPTSFMIPQEILNPSCRSPGFRIKGKTDSPSPPPSPSPSDNDDKYAAPQTTLSSATTSSSSSFRFSFTSERFKMAIQESMEKSSGADALTSPEPKPAKVVDSSVPQGHVEECTEQQTSSSVCETSNHAISQMEILESSASTATIELSQDTTFATVGNNNEDQHSIPTVVPEHPMPASDEHASDEPSSEFGNWKCPIQSHEYSATRPTAAAANTHAQAIATTSLSESNAMSEENPAEKSAAVSGPWPSIRAGWQSMRRMLARRWSSVVPVQQSWCGGSSRLAM
ncbi:hypothetical protein EDD21DRAFT_363823 [Dissophora ornata]|nr:hypothetical protein BGZ58_006090 [Dissophora ornata]KAI8605345.1 hypothetical protein EDD21DRAFT_363823 [Dissophora ornata]